MVTPTRLLIALALGCAGSALLLGTAAANAEPAPKAFTIRSSLDGKTVLPRRIHWIAYPSDPVLFPGVEFLIDGKVVFANRLSPFAFGDDGRDEEIGGVNTGYLVTSWLSPGLHRFTVRAKAIVGGQRTFAEKTVTARVAAPASPPAQLAGTWQRQLDTAVPPDPDRLYKSVTAQPGTYRMEIDRRYVRVSGPAPGRHLKVDFVADPRTLTFRGPVWTGGPGEGAGCDPWGPDARYAWSVQEGTLTLEPAGKPDACKQRAAVMTGEWTRVG